MALLRLLHTTSGMNCAIAFGLGVLLAAGTGVQARQQENQWDLPPMSAVFVYEPNGGFSASTDGWNFSILEHVPYNSGLPNVAHAVPKTSQSGSLVTTRFFGYGAAVKGQAADRTRVTAKFDSGETNTTTQDGVGDVTNVTSVFAAQRENKWRTLTVTLDEGELLIQGIIIYFDMDFNYPSVQNVQYRAVNPTTDDYRYMHPHFTVTGGTWETQKLYEPGGEFQGFQRP